MSRTNELVLRVLLHHEEGLTTEVPSLLQGLLPLFVDEAKATKHVPLKVNLFPELALDNEELQEQLSERIDSSEISEGVLELACVLFSVVHCSATARHR